MYNIEEDIKVISSSHIGKYIGNNELKEFFYPFGFWMFILFMGLLIIGGIYDSFFKDPKEKADYHWKELEKLDEKQ